MSNNLTDINDEIIQYRLTGKVYSSIKLNKEISYVLSNICIDLQSIECDKDTKLEKNGMQLNVEFSAYITCTDSHEARTMLVEILDIVFLGFNKNYILHYDIKEWIRYRNKGWCGSSSLYFSVFTYKNIDEEIIDKTKTLITYINKIKANGHYKEYASKVISLFKRGMELEIIALEDSFINYFKIIENVSNKLQDKRFIKFYDNNQYVIDVIKLKLDLKIKQQIYFLIIAFNLREFKELDKLVALANLRHSIAHTKTEITQDQLVLCKEFSFQIILSYFQFLSKI
jgi:hypothetical protein